MKASRKITVSAKLVTGVLALSFFIASCGKKGTCPAYYTHDSYGLKNSTWALLEKVTEQQSKI